MLRGYVAMIDVLGFSELIRRGPAEETFSGYLNCVRSATADARVAYVVFSDTIVLTIEDQGEQSLLTLAKACSRLFHDLLCVGIPIRGAIAFGDFARDTSVSQSVFVAGSAVIDAYHFEQQQDWVGVMLAPSARERIKDLGDRCLTKFSNNDDFLRRVEWAGVIQRCYEIPFHKPQDGQPHTYDGFAIVPRKSKFIPAAIKASIHEATEKLGWLRSIAPSPASQRKYHSALEWLDLVQSQWHAATAQEVWDKL